MSGARWLLLRDPALLMPAPRLGRRAGSRWTAEPLPAEPRNGAGVGTSTVEVGATCNVAGLPHAASTWWTFSGTAALYAAAHTLGLGPGDGILFPAYNCGHEVEPFLRRGIRPAFYRIGPGLRAEPDDVERRIRSDTRAVLLTHYFGFPQDVEAFRELCDRRGLLLIEDCAHALFSAHEGRPLGSRGDAAVFSLRKSLPLTDGGALLLRDAPAGDAPMLCGPPRRPVALKRLDLWKKSLLQAASPPGWLLSRAALLALAPALRLRETLEAHGVGARASWYDPDDEAFDFPDEVLSWQMSDLAAAALTALDSAAIRAIRAVRRAHYARLLEPLRVLPGARLLLPDLPPEVCPLFLPLAVDRPQQVVERLRADGISAAPWWEGFHPSVPWDEYPEAVELKRTGIVLPIHQALRPRHIERTACALERALHATRPTRS